jgi:hypothetical protein
VNEYDPALVAELERLAPSLPASPDWNDVLRRADVRARPARAVLVVALLVAVSALSAPALGVSGKVRQLLGIGARPQVQFVARLHPVSGSGSGSFSATPVKAFTQVGSDRTVGFTRRVRFTLRVADLSGPVTSAWLRITPPRASRGTESTVPLCRPCSATTTGVLRFRGIMLVLISGRATVEVATRAHPEGELRGQIMAAR